MSAEYFENKAQVVWTTLTRVTMLRSLCENQQWRQSEKYVLLCYTVESKSHNMKENQLFCLSITLRLTGLNIGHFLFPSIGYITLT